MTNNEILLDAFIQILGVPADVDVSELEYSYTPGWESMAHMRLVAKIESGFDILLTTDDIVGMSSFERAREIVMQHGIDFTV